MSQYQHTDTTVTNGSATVTLVGIDATGDLAAGDWFGINGTGIITYQIASAPTFAAGDTTVTLTTTYAGTTGTGLTGIFLPAGSFTSPDSFIIAARGDLELPAMMGRLAIQLQAKYSNIGASSNIDDGTY